MTLRQPIRSVSYTAALVICSGASNPSPAAQLVINQSPGVVGEAISFIANGQLDLDTSDGVAEFVVDFSPAFLANPLGEISAYSSFRTVNWGEGQDTSAISVAEYVSDGAEQVVPIADFEPVTLTATGYTAGDVPFPAPFPFELHQFGVRIEGLIGGPVVTFQKDAQTAGRGGGQVGQVVPEPDAVLLVICGLAGLLAFRSNHRSCA